MFKKFPAVAALFCSITAFAQQKPLNDTTVLNTVQVSAVKAGDKMPVTKTNISREEIEKTNTGRDLPFILDQTPGIVVNSDAGNGIGYTGIRLRGSDASRINVTLNGIPYNDAESQGTFFVDLPDIASGTDNIQIQRGVGTSTNGAGAFGGSIHINTNEDNAKKRLQLNNSAGSYGSLKNTLLYNSGTFAKHFTADFRGSNIQSNGYVDRAKTRMQSLYGSLGWQNKNDGFRLNVIYGKEKTYQSWYGITDDQLINDRTYNSAGTEKAGTPYDNETDNYKQTHLQLFYNHSFSKYLKSTVALYYTHGAGYYEQYKASAKLESYGLPAFIHGTDTTLKTDLVRRLWLNNDLYGTIISLQYKKEKTDLIFGGGYNSYDGLHYGEVISAKAQAAIPNNFRYYENDAHKNDFSIYGKLTQNILPNLFAFIDLQVRKVNYDINGFRYNPQIKLYNKYSFFNPKAGLTYIKANTQAYIFYGHAAKEPNRDDFETGLTQLPKAEKLNDYETGVQQKFKGFSWGANLYYMDYKDQLVLTGQINDVGAYTRTNIKKSYRTGIEFQALGQANTWLQFNANFALSRNKVKDFNEFIDNYDNGNQEKNNYKNADIAFSPAVVAFASATIKPFKNLEISLPAKYVGRQYLDNTENKFRSLRPYYTQDIDTRYMLNLKGIQKIELFANLYNVFSRKYTPNGYTYSYVDGGKLTTENYYFPMAPINFMGGINISF